MRGDLRVGIAQWTPGSDPGASLRTAEAAVRELNGTDLSWLVGLVITVPLYYLLAVRQAARRPTSERGLQQAA